MKTIQQQLTWKLLLGITLPLILGGLGVFLLTRGALVEQFDTTLRAQAVAIATATSQSGTHTDVDIPDSLMRKSDEGRPMSFFQLWGRDGTTLKRSESLRNLDLPRRFGTFEKPKFWNLRLPHGAAGRAIGLRFTPRTSIEGTPPSTPTEAILVVASDRDELDDALTSLTFALLGCGAALLAVTLLLVPRLLRRELAPLDELAAQATRINARSLAMRFPTDGLPGELAPISRRLNDLLARLEQSFERERRFSADVAHELRTPIAELRSLAEVALKWPETREAATDRETLAIAVQMEGVVTRLLALLRSEHGQLPSTRERVALAPLVESVWQSFARNAATNQLQVSVSVPHSIVIETDAALLRSILTNLVDNAVEYTPKGGAVRILGEAAGDKYAVHVINTADNLTTEDMSHFFERFWRKDSARSDSKHVGLGLPLVQAFCECLGLQLAARLVDSATFSVSVTGLTAAAEGRPN